MHNTELNKLRAIGPFYTMVLPSGRADNRVLTRLKVCKVEIIVVVAMLPCISIVDAIERLSSNTNVDLLDATCAITLVVVVIKRNLK